MRQGSRQKEDISLTNEKGIVLSKKMHKLLLLSISKSVQSSAIPKYLLSDKLYSTGILSREIMSLMGSFANLNLN